MPYKNYKTNLNQTELQQGLRFVIYFEKEIKPHRGEYNWENSSFKDYCKRIGIKWRKEIGSRKGYEGFFIKVARKNNNEPRDCAHCFLRHIRNSFAHGNICKDKTYYILTDYEKNNNQSMAFKIKKEYLWDYISELIKTRNQTN